MVVLVAWLVAVFVALLVCAALALGVKGHAARLRRSAEAANADLAPVLDTLRSGSAQLRTATKRSSPGGMDNQRRA